MGGGGAHKPKQPKQYARLNTKMQLATKCKACGIINISKYVNKF